MIGLLGEKNLVYQFELQPACDMNIYVMLYSEIKLKSGFLSNYWNGFLMASKWSCTCGQGCKHWFEIQIYMFRISSVPQSLWFSDNFFLKTPL